MSWDVTTYSPTILSVIIGSMDVTSKLIAGSLSITTQLDGIRHASFMVQHSGAYFPHFGQNVTITGTAGATTILFTGFIQTVDLTGDDPVEGISDTLTTVITSDGYNSLAIRRTTGNNLWQSTPFVVGYFAGDVVEAMLNGVLLGSDDITEDAVNFPIQQGAYIEKYPSDGRAMSVSTVLDDMAAASGFHWFIDNDKHLHFAGDETIGTHSDIIETTSDLTSLHVIESVVNYHNKVFIKGNSGYGYENLPVDSIKEDTIQIAARQTIEGGGSGVYGAIIDDSTICLQVDADTVADNYLLTYSVLPVTITFDTHMLDFAPGQTLHVTKSKYAIDGDFLVTQVDLHDAGVLVLQAAVTLEQVILTA